MALDLTENVLSGLNGQVVSPIIVLTVDGIPFIYGTGDVNNFNLYDGSTAYDTPEQFYNGLQPGAFEALPLISLKATTKTIKQQILQDKKGTGSSGNSVISLIDNGRVSGAFSPGRYVPDILSTKAQVWVFFGSGSFPEDAVKIFAGRITKVEYPLGLVNITISHPEELKRAEIFNEYISNTVGAIIPTEPAVEVDDATGLILALSTNNLLVTAQTYIQIDDEIMRVVDINYENNFIIVVRGQFGTTDAAHDANAEVTSIYNFTGDAINLALAIMLSGGGGEISQFTIFEGDVYPANIHSIKVNYNLIKGDSLIIDGVKRKIIQVGDKHIRVETPVLSASTIRTSSQFDILNDDFGLAMATEEVDIARHLSIQGQFTSSLPELDFFIRDETDGKQFINEELYFPCGLYQIPRDARASVGTNAPPTASPQTKTLDETTVLNWSKLKVSRAVNEYFYNSVLYRYETDLFSTRFLANKGFISAKSINRITGIKNRTFRVDSTGLRDDIETRATIDINAARALERYEFSAQKITVVTNYKTGFPIEVGDPVFFKIDELTNPANGRRGYGPKVFDVINKNISLVSGKTTLLLLETIFSANVRFGLVSPASTIGATSTSTNIVVVNSYSTVPGIDDETDKWLGLETAKIRILEADGITLADSGVLDAVVDANNLTVSELTSAPTNGQIIEFQTYSNALEIERDGYIFINPSDSISAVVSQTTWTVSDPTLYFEDAIVRAWSQDLQNWQETPLLVTEVNGNNITVDNVPEFEVAAGDFIELIGFNINNGAPYAIG